MMALLLVAAMLMALPTEVSAASMPREAGSEDSGAEFLIPESPLDVALQEYGRMTGAAVLADGALLSGRISARVEGVFTARGALMKMLEGTGLVPHFVSRDAFTLESSGNDSGVFSGSVAGLTRADHGLVSRLQQTVGALLCGTSMARPGGYRAAIQIWFGSVGDVDRVALLGSTGLAERDRIIERTLREIRMDDPGMNRLSPVTVLILPVRPGLESPCREDRAQ